MQSDFKINCQRRRTRRPFLWHRHLSVVKSGVLAVATGLALGAATPAHAGHWVVELTGNAAAYQNNYSFQNNLPASQGPEGDTMALLGAGNLVYGQFYEGEEAADVAMAVVNGTPNTITCNLTVQATLVWTPDQYTGNPMPPPNPTVLEIGVADAGQLDEGGPEPPAVIGTPEYMQAYDGFTNGTLRDPCVYDLMSYLTTTPPQPNVGWRESQSESQGSYVETNLPVTLQTTGLYKGYYTAQLPQRLMGLGKLPDLYVTSSPGGNMDYTVIVESNPSTTVPDYTITVAPCSISHRGSQPVPVIVTVAAVRGTGFTGTVNLSLVGQTGAVPAPPANDSVYLQALPYSTIGGSPATINQPAGVIDPQEQSSGPGDAEVFGGVTSSFSSTSVTLTSTVQSATVTLYLSSATGAVGTFPIEVQGSCTSSDFVTTRDGFNTLTISP